MVRFLLVLVLIFSIQVSLVGFVHAQTGERQYWALLIGISDYAPTGPGGPDLNYCHDDANDWYTTLTSQHGWYPSHIIKLINSTATKTNIQSSLVSLEGMIGPNDLFLFTYAGHGGYTTIDSTQHEFLYTFDEEEILDDELTSWLANIEAGVIVAVLDSCYSGGFIQGLTSVTSGLTLRTLPDLPHKIVEGTLVRDLAKPGYLVLTACDVSELCVESSELQNGVFTYYLVEGIDTSLGIPADSNHDKFVSFQEAFYYASPRATAYYAYQHAQIYDGVGAEVDMENSVPNPISESDSNVVNSAEDSVYFIYPDYTGSKPPGVTYAWLSDWTATGYIMGMCSNIQHEATDTNPTIVNGSEGSIKLQDATIVLFGGPLVNAPVHYYEEHRMAPLYYQSVGSVLYWYHRDGTRIDETALQSSQKSSQDLFVVESFVDSSHNMIFIVYGYGWKGTYAAGKFFKFIVYPNIGSYTSSYYVFKWVDGNSDGFVDLNEISQTPIVQG
jgi:hypothetical protein